MAALCFEKAGDTNWEKLAEACGLRASADQIRGTDPESYFGYLRKAAGVFESIGKLESAASCYCDLGEYERAGKIFMDKCGKSDAAAECFTLAGCYGEAAEAYAKGDQFSNCLSVCKRGKLFDKGMQYIVNRKELANFKSNELEEVAQEFLESCALNYHEHKDSNSMLKFVRAFCSMESKRTFLRSLGCLDELLLLEEESGHFAEAAELARSWGDLLKEADLLEKAGQFKESGLLLLWYVFSNSLWGNGNRGWPLKRFPQKKELCDKVKFLAKMDSDVMYDLVCSELKILSDQHISLRELKKDFYVSQKNRSLRGELLSTRKILDKHLYLNSSKYDWEDELPVDIHMHCEEKMFQNRVSVRTLVYYWNLWKKHVMDIFRSSKDLKNEVANTHSGHADLCLYYFGARKLCEKGNMVYLSLNKDADWIRNTGNKGFRSDEKHIQFDARELVFAIRSYWESELISVGIKVLETLDALRKSKSSGSAFHQSTSLLHIFEVSKFLLDIQYHNLGIPYKNKLQNFLDISLTYFDLVFPRDWRNAVSGDLVSLRDTDLSFNLLNEIILRNVEIKGALTYWETGRAMMIFLGSRTSLKKESIKGSMEHQKENRIWKSPDYISTHSYVYLLDRLLLMLSSLTGILFTTKSYFVEWFSYLPSTDTTFLALQQNLMLAELLEMIVQRIEDMLYNVKTTEAWIRGSKIIVSDYLPLVVLRLVMMLSLICLQIPCKSKVLLSLLTVEKSIVHLLPKKLVAKLQRRSSGLSLNLNPEVVAEAFESVEDPLLIGYSGNKIPQFHAPCAIFVDLKKSKQEIMSVLLPRKYTHSGQTSSNNVDAGTTPKISSSNTLPEENMNMNRVELRVNWEVLEEISEAMKGNKGMPLNTLSTAAMVKEVDNNIGTLATILDEQKLCSGNDARVVREAYDVFGLLSSAFDTSPREVGQSVLLKDVSEVKQTGDGAVLENQNECDNTEDGSNKKGKGSNKGNKSKKSKDSSLADGFIESKYRRTYNERYNLVSRGINIESDRCPLCEIAIETACHSLIECHMVIPFWRKVWNWWQLTPPTSFPLLSTKDINMGSLVNLGNPKLNKFLHGVFQCGLWLVRNGDIGPRDSGVAHNGA
ncbi:UvrD-like helicase, ATP-binding domain, P-loop containing nucleoside triphosphate hydrolase [Tanacetum coccineum]